MKYLIDGKAVEVLDKTRVFGYCEKASLQSELDKLDQHREILIKEINKTQKK